MTYSVMSSDASLSPRARLWELFGAGEEAAPNLDPGQKFCRTQIAAAAAAALGTREGAALLGGGEVSIIQRRFQAWGWPVPV